MSQGFEDPETVAPSPQRSPSARSGRPDIVRSQSTGSTGGCWTCRVRRKKCDEQREGDSCATCLRLKIKCLGWGPRRPEWLKDKQAVKAYKEEIKAQLARQGMIRGIPRSVASTPTTPSSFSHHLEPNTYDLTPHSAGLVASHDYYTYEEGQGLHSPGYSFSSSGDSDISSLGIYEDPTASHAGPSSSSGLYHGRSEHTPGTSRIDISRYQSYPQAAQIPAGALTSYAVPPANAVEGEYVLYYFQHVQKLQFFPSDNRLTDALYKSILEEPHGAVTNAVCSLASLHYTNSRVAQGLEQENPDLQTTLAMRFYNHTCYQLNTSKFTRGHYGAKDATAALHLASFSIFSKPPTDWAPMLEIACDWFGQSDIFVAEDPVACLMNMDYLGQFAAKATIWLDIVSSVSLLQPPRYLSLYRRLLGAGTTYWAGTSAASRPSPSLGMERFTGCADAVLLAIAEISALAHWKAQELRRGSLSVRELVRRGDDIERQWLQGPRVPSALEQGQARAGSSRVPSPLALASFPADGQTHPSVYSQDAGGLVAELYRESAILYLHITLNDCISDISNSVNYIIQLLQRIPRTDDRSLIFPLFLAACASDGQCRDVFWAWFIDQEANGIGSASRIRSLLESLWKQRDITRGVSTVDWRDIMRELGLNLLLA
ncbi:hypothetical protein GLOTRDRAFT_130692 [Gloeophyllum trabeum ATCC 11539]|uniref:Zn(2)-C6 fungal-type domain-containing protein n=1 Tax=Gloeophyllum trabeum (strain ATCC 11539 / FP-39264 / Madison 617) TaxID=670483 RepID=S7RNI0_GLOTA|nr:uncharacterized protein GLOTRDRAFT_130692 [Gloeophyllum trabeum ATCC 11539]EPQ54324.1 hypothetical protein GLOTRDRAFT_130692 [Gloeophyllum trabeum ATCC 11539]